MIAYFVAAIAIFQLAAWLMVRYRSRRAQRLDKGADYEAAGMPAASRISAFGKVPQIVMNVYRVIAFRSTLDIGESYTLSVAEVLVTCAYIAALFVWSFIDSEKSLLDVCLINILTRDI